AAFARGQLMMLGHFLDDEAVALKCNFTSGAGSFAFKIAFDERFAKHSPGVHLEIDNLEALHARSDLRWMDSCAVSVQPMLHRLWPERRMVQHLLIATGRWRGTLLLGLLPLARAVKRLFRRHAVQSSNVGQPTDLVDPSHDGEETAVSRPVPETATVGESRN